MKPPLTSASLTHKASIISITALTLVVLIYHQSYPLSWFIICKHLKSSSLESIFALNSI